MSFFRLAAVDLDDTLLGPDKEISRANLEAVHALRARGVCVALASGRRHANMLRFHRQLGLGPDDVIVSCNGALVQTAETGRVLHERRVPYDLAREILADEEKHIDFIETQFQLIGQIGIQNYVQMQSEAVEG